MTMTLIGDVLFTLILTLMADKVGRRRTLFLGSSLMILSGSIFAFVDHYWLLLFAAVIGIISATGSDFGPFRAIEESILSHLTTLETRSDVLSWYVTMASMGSAFGTETSGRVVDSLRDLLGWTSVEAYHAIFGLYVIMGSLNMGFILLMSDLTEVDKVVEEKMEDSEMLLVGNDAVAGKDGVESEEVDGDVEHVGPSVLGPSRANLAKEKSRFAQISPRTRSVMFKLWPLLIVDSLADGMVGYSLTAYYMEQRFQISASTLGDITSISYFLSAISTIFAGPLANRLGLINTMVFTHLPSSAAVLLFPLAPNLTLTIILFFIRTGLNNMDQAPRAAFIAAVVQPSERTAVMGITGTLRTLAATAGPSVTGLLAENDRFWIAFVAAGLLRIAYDCGLWALFININLKDEDS